LRLNWRKGLLFIPILKKGLQMPKKNDSAENPAPESESLTLEKLDLPSAEISAEEIAEEIAAEMPTPTASTDGEIFDDFPEIGEGETAPDLFSNTKDKSGKAFDRALHKLDEAGFPRFDKRGYFIPLNKGRIPAGGRKEGETPPPQSKPLDGAMGALVDEYHNAATLYVDVSTSVLSGAISEEWNPESKAERESLINSVAAYLRYKGDIDLPPGQVLALAIIAYSGKRINKPKTKEKLTLLFVRIKKFFKKSSPEIE